MRNYKKKTERGKVGLDVVERAVLAHFQEQQSFRSLAEEYNIPVRSLVRYCHKWKTAGKIYAGYPKTRVFTDVQEDDLCEYLKKISDVYFGLSSKEIRKLAYQFASVNCKQHIPTAWINNKMAGEDWLTSYLKRHSSLSIRTPETSLASFNEKNIGLFFDNLKTIFGRLQLSPSEIWNVDEIGITSEKANRVVARKGVERIEKITPAEGGSLVTLVLAASASGNTIPPFFVFPRKNYKDRFLRGAPTGSNGDANPSGRLTGSSFLKFSHHFVAHTRISNERPQLLLLDNHDSQLSTEALVMFKANGTTVISFPPRYGHELQPLCRSVYGPLTKYVSAACDAWVTNHPGQTMAIYDIPGIVSVALHRAASPPNITAGFRDTGIFPLNSDIVPQRSLSLFFRRTDLKL